MAQKRRLIVSLMLVVVLALFGGIMAACSEKVFTVTFDSNGGSPVVSKEVKDGKLLEKPEDPTKDHHDFTGWVKEDGTSFNFEEEKIKSDITLKATWQIHTYNVTFVTGQGATQIDAQTIDHGGRVTRPTNPTLAGKVFVNWYEDQACTRLYDFDTAVEGNDTLYARFVERIEEVYTVSFVGSETAIAPITTNAAGMIERIDLPVAEKEGKVFVGWWMSDFEDATKLSSQYIDQQLKQNTVLYAVYEGDRALNLNVTASGANWNSLGALKQYRVTITGPDGEKVVDNQGTPAIVFDYDFANAEAGEYKVEVTVDSQTTVGYYNNKALPKVSIFEVDGFVLSYNDVGADKYVIRIDCGNIEHEDEEIDKSECLCGKS